MQMGNSEKVQRLFAVLIFIDIEYLVYKIHCPAESNIVIFPSAVSYLGIFQSGAEPDAADMFSNTFKHLASQLGINPAYNYQFRI